jgi:hypothetical protein
MARALNHVSDADSRADAPAVQVDPVASLAGEGLTVGDRGPTARALSHRCSGRADGNHVGSYSNRGARDGGVLHQVALPAVGDESVRAQHGEAKSGAEAAEAMRHGRRSGRRVALRFAKRPHVDSLDRQADGQAR